MVKYSRMNLNEDVLNEIGKEVKTNQSFSIKKCSKQIKDCMAISNLKKLNEKSNIMFTLFRFCLHAHPQSPFFLVNKIIMNLYFRTSRFIKTQKVLIGRH